MPNGPLTSRLQKICEGDEILMAKKPVGTLVLDALKPGKRLWLISTGTGVAPFASLIRDPQVYEQFNEVILTHTCRTTCDLAYGVDLMNRIAADPLVGEVAAGKLHYYPSTTQEPSVRRGRITGLIRDGSLCGFTYRHSDLVVALVFTQ